MIPDEAMDAALKAIGHLPTVANESRRKTVQAILEAAAPHLMAAAWEEGGRAAIEREHAYGADEKAKFANPYRTKEPK